jgi:hypothetical protein
VSRTIQQARRGRYLPPAEPPRERISRGDLVGLVGIVLVGVFLFVILPAMQW